MGKTVCDLCGKKDFASKRGYSIHRVSCAKKNCGIPTRKVQPPPGKEPVRKRAATKGVEVHITICGGAADVVIKSGVQ
jgi:hypothetical protein